MTIVLNFLHFIKDIIKNRKTLWDLSKNDFKARYASSFLGAIWAFIQPLVTILVFWFVFEVGFKTPPRSDVPFIVWYVPAYLVWTYFSDSLIGAANSIREYSYLVKKVHFRVSLIPLVKIVSASIVHLGFILLIFIICQIYGVGFSICNVQVIYYFLCTLILLVGLGWLLSAIAAFVPDVVNVVNVIIQIGFWATPIFWSPDEMSPVVQSVLKINPMFYICRGYRDCFIDNMWFWQRGYTNYYFWVTTIIIFVLGAVVFKRLRPHFADVL